jgi:hypothetical protein
MKRRITIALIAFCLLLSLALWNVGNGAKAKSAHAAFAPSMAGFLVMNTDDAGPGSL